MAAFGDTALVNAGCCSSRSSRPSPRPYTAHIGGLGEYADTGNGQPGPQETGVRHIDLIGAPLTASQPTETGTQIGGDARLAQVQRQLLNVIGSRAGTDRSC